MIELIIQLFSKVIIPLFGLILIAVIIALKARENNRIRRKNAPPPICDSCGQLKRKGGEYHYYFHCEAKGSFNIPPIFCEDYILREGNKTDEQHSSSGTD